ncbi:Crp/Fnr family transcriptional regulator [Gudongella sp. SC589]|uniref:Crp/Fnr family transcriptional regulator n=1 Tax=Gudongella sp. SC589 TaxID=3385990 RepID=UPI0039048372
MEYIGRMINSIEPFVNIEPHRLEEAIRKDNVKTKRFQGNQLVYLQGEVCTTMDIVLKGTVDIHSIDQEGNVITLARFKKGDIVGVNLLFSTDSAYPFSVTAVEDTEILQLSKGLLLELSRDNPRFTESLLQIVSDKAISLANWITEISMKPLREKIMDFVQMERKRQGGERIILPTSKKELAERLGVQRTSLSRELQKMKREGILDYDRASITLLE